MSYARVILFLDRLNDLPPPSVWGSSPGPIGLREPEPDGIAGNMGTNPVLAFSQVNGDLGRLCFSLFTAAPEPLRFCFFIHGVVRRAQVFGR